MAGAGSGIASARDGRLTPGHTSPTSRPHWVAVGPRRLPLSLRPTSERLLYGSLEAAEVPVAVPESEGKVIDLLFDLGVSRLPSSRGPGSTAPQLPAPRPTAFVPSSGAVDSGDV